MKNLFTKWFTRKQPLIKKEQGIESYLQLEKERDDWLKQELEKPLYYVEATDILGNAYRTKELNPYAFIKRDNSEVRKVSSYDSAEDLVRDYRSEEYKWFSSHTPPKKVNIDHIISFEIKKVPVGYLESSRKAGL